MPEGQGVGRGRRDSRLAYRKRASPYLYSAALLIFMRRTTPVEPSEPIEPAEPLSLAIKGRVAPGLTLKFESRDG